jgi:signal transduction histidine kinase/BarA-like signal transduction histidine kinase
MAMFLSKFCWLLAYDLDSNSTSIRRLEVNLFSAICPVANPKRDYPFYCQMRRTYFATILCMWWCVFHLLLSYEYLPPLICRCFIFGAVVSAVGLGMMRYQRLARFTPWWLFGVISPAVYLISFYEGSIMVIGRVPHLISMWTFLLGRKGLVLSTLVNAFGLFWILGKYADPTTISGIYADRLSLLRHTFVMLNTWTVVWSAAALYLGNELVQKLESETKSREDFMAKLSHDFRTTLMGISGSWDLLYHPSGEKPAKVFTIEEVDVMLRRSINNMTRLAEDLLDVSKLSSGKFQLKKSVFNVHEPINDAITWVSPIANEKHLKINHHSNLPVPYFIESDSVRMNQILVNLLNNAVKFTPQGGSVTIHTSRSFASKMTPDVQKLQITVSDTGPGIDPKQLDLIFDPYMQAATHSVQSTGVGLGLAIVRELVGKFKGSVAAFNAPGGGAIFKIELPVVEHRPTEILPAKDEGRDFQQSLPLLYGKKALLAEDNLVSNAVICALLQQLGFEVQRVLNGKEALATLQGHGFKYFDVIMLDLEMPEINGWQLVDILSLYDHSPIVIITASQTECIAEELTRKGVVGILGKPMTRIDLATRLAAIFRVDV